MSEKDRKTVEFQDPGRYRKDGNNLTNRKQPEKKRPELDRSLRHFENDGIKKIVESKTTLEKLFWIILITLAFAIAGYEIYKAVSDYISSPTVTAYKIVAQKEMSFPQIYLCPSAPVRKSYLRTGRHKVNRAMELANHLFVKENAGKPSANKSASGDSDRKKRSLWGNEEIFDEDSHVYDSPLMTEMHRIKRDSVTHGNFSTNIHNGTNTTSAPITTTRKPAPVYPDDTSEFLNQTFMDMGVDQGDTFLACQFRSFFVNMVPCKEILKAVLDPVYGKCFLVDVTEERKQAVPAQGLTIILNIKSQEYPHNDALTPKFAGLTMSVAKQYDPSGFERVLIPPNSYSKVDIVAQHLKFLNVDSGPSKQLCNTPDDFPYQYLNASYSQSSCYLECHLRTVVNRCNCLLTMDHIFYNKDKMNTTSFCTLGDALNCVEPNVTDSNDAQDEIAKCTDNCQIPCESWRFTSRVSHMPLNKVAFPKFPPNTTLEDFIYIQIAFPFLEYDEFAQDWSMTVTDMVGTIGGHIGLWLGASMLTLMQIPIMLFTLSGFHAFHKTKPVLKKVTSTLSRPTVYKE